MTARVRRSLVAANRPESAPQVLEPENDWAMLNRNYCHLCDEMLATAVTFGITPALIDVDSDPILTARWDEDVPVLLFRGEAICWHRFDVQAVVAVMASASYKMVS